MRGAGAWVMAGLVPVLVGLFVWGIVDGRATSRPWRACGDPPRSTTAAEHLQACDAAIHGGHVSVLDLPRAYGIRGQLRLERKDYVRAIADLDKAAVLEPYDGARQNAACWARAVAGLELDQARERCDRAIELWADQQEEYAQALDSRGLVGLKQGRFADAFADYDKAVKARPDLPHYRYGRGIAALRLGMIVQGQADLAAARKFDDRAMRAYASYGIAP